MRRRYNPYTYPRWLKNFRAVVAQFSIPFCVFQGIRTLLFPTSFDILFLATLILIAVALHLQII
ncbi:hypothetical protein [Bacillus sp. B15-48]|uniref:hypothetical protein n=1 Tax=Bacillus sp. B15-48 TaxID=1548601 RepID=UPI00193F0F25|nr:hypothetical protein [Bacillus sp. B15-48]MBM4762456.1 hypothetical protein [Bacillus sp. B15-48]